MLCENQKLKFLVFAYHRAMMSGLSESLHDKHIKFIRIDGDTPPSERPVRLLLHVFLLHTLHVHIFMIISFEYKID